MFADQRPCKFYKLTTISEVLQGISYINLTKGDLFFYL